MFQMQLPNFIIKAGRKEEFATNYLGIDQEKFPYFVLVSIDYLDGDVEMLGIALPTRKAMERHVVSLLVAMRAEFPDQNT